MRAILINGNEKTMTPVVLPREARALDEKIKSLIDTTNPVFQPIGHGESLIAVDCDCQVKENNLAFMLHFLPTPSFGSILLLGYDSATQNFTELKTSIDVIYLARNITYFEKEESKNILRRYNNYVTKLQSGR